MNTMNNKLPLLDLLVVFGVEWPRGSHFAVQAKNGEIHYSDKPFQFKPDQGTWFFTDHGKIKGFTNRLPMASNRTNSCHLLNGCVSRTLFNETIEMLFQTRNCKANPDDLVSDLTLTELMIKHVAYWPGEARSAYQLSNGKLLFRTAGGEILQVNQLPRVGFNYKNCIVTRKCWIEAVKGHYANMEDEKIAVLVTPVKSEAAKHGEALEELAKQIMTDERPDNVTTDKLKKVTCCSNTDDPRGKARIRFNFGDSVEYMNVTANMDRRDVANAARFFADKLLNTPLELPEEKKPVAHGGPIKRGVATDIERPELVAGTSWDQIISDLGQAAVVAIKSDKPQLKITTAEDGALVLGVADKPKATVASTPCSKTDSWSDTFKRIAAKMSHAQAMDRIIGQNKPFQSAHSKTDDVALAIAMALAADAPKKQVVTDESKIIVKPWVTNPWTRKFQDIIAGVKPSETLAGFVKAQEDFNDSFDKRNADIAARKAADKTRHDDALLLKIIQTTGVSIHMSSHCGHYCKTIRQACEYLASQNPGEALLFDRGTYSMIIQAMHRAELHSQDRMLSVMGVKIHEALVFNCHQIGKSVTNLSELIRYIELNRGLKDIYLRPEVFAQVSAEVKSYTCFANL